MICRLLTQCVSKNPLSGPLLLNTRKESSSEARHFADAKASHEAKQKKFDSAELTWTMCAGTD